MRSLASARPTAQARKTWAGASAAIDGPLPPAVRGAPLMQELLITHREPHGRTGLRLRGPPADGEHIGEAAGAHGVEVLEHPPGHVLEHDETVRVLLAGECG